VDDVVTAVCPVVIEAGAAAERAVRGGAANF